jgi:hypothetical protein
MTSRVLYAPAVEDAGDAPNFRIPDLPVSPDALDTCSRPRGIISQMAAYKRFRGSKLARWALSALTQSSVGRQQERGVEFHSTPLSGSNTTFAAKPRLSAHPSQAVSPWNTTTVREIADLAGAGTFGNGHWA